MTTMNLLDFASFATPTRELPAIADGRAIDLPLGSDLRVASKQSARFGDGGDFFEVFEHASRSVSTVVADVCGNGAAAAQVAARIRPFLHHSLARGESPGRVLAALNEALVDEGLPDRFVTAVAVRVDVLTGLVEIACAGHLGPFVRQSSGRVQAIDRATGVPRGLVPGERYEEIRVRLQPEDALVLVTDGITDPLSSADDPLGEAAFALLLERAPRVTLDLCEMLLLDGAPTRDDATVLVLQLPARAATPIAA
ncbi:MAG TPA: PP2C family protein-serine/threonine phosphatase [Polyangia bacterium]|nr:PP2C family protein-serine/threonine phosphatase [Polyangia bacterium]